MTAFDPYHSFGSVHTFMGIFSSLRNQQRVAPAAMQIPDFVVSVTAKLHSVKAHLEDLIATKELVFSWSPTASGSMSGSTISATIPAYSPTEHDVCREVDGFFENLSSAFDIFAHVINLVYFAQPLIARRVSFNRITNTMLFSHSREPLTQKLAVTRTQQWYRDFSQFRRCTHHRKIIKCKIITEYLTSQTSWPVVKVILLPDNPFAQTPTYFKNRTMRNFGVGIFKDVLRALDEMYSMMEVRSRIANRIPV